jgi:small-conductance mechanosensitive channel
MEGLRNFLQLELINVGEFSIRVYSILSILIIFVITKLVLWIIRKTLLCRKHSKLDKGARYALFQIIKYVVWVIAIGLFLEIIGIKLTVLIAGSAALLVGVG